jgi:hypothetical protein
MENKSLTEWNEYVLRLRYDYLKALYSELESKIQKLEKRMSNLEFENEKLRDVLNNYKPLSEDEEIWLKIRGKAIESNSLSLLNPSKRYSFQIVEVSKDFIRVDKIKEIKLTKEIFRSLYNHLKVKKDWMKIGASIRNTKIDTVEGYLKENFFGEDMNGPMTAPWISALIVRADVGIEFNNKSLGQAIKYNRM